ncbi:hypothetical protein BDW22DRAFT_390587 [Trametopsis cervina]|nr:hypothetical protein BDW22DRAFT_390587 [Trametopsis cervina]
MRYANQIRLWTICTLPLIPATSALTGDSWCGTLMCVDAIVDGSIVTYELKALNQLGWMSIGFGPEMAGSPLVIMWPNEDGTVYLSQRKAVGHVPPVLDSDPPRIASVSTHVDLSSPTTPILAFDIPKNNDTVQSLIWAFGVVRPAPDPDTDIQQHLDAGSFSLDLRRNRGGGNEGGNGTSLAVSPTPTSSSASSSSPVSTAPDITSSTSSHASSASPSTLSSPSELPQIEAPPDSPSDALRAVLAAHALLSFFGFCVCLPLSLIITRWCRTVTHHWFRLHWTIIVFLALPLGTLGWALGPAVVALRGRRHVVNDHQIGGVILSALCLVEVAFGISIHRRQPKSGRVHPFRNLLHVGAGWFIVGFSFYETITGVARDAMLSASTRKSLIIACVILAALVAVAYLTGVVRLRRQLDQERLGWHLSFASGPTVPRGGHTSHQHHVVRAPAIGGRLGSDWRDDGTHDVFSQTSLNGPVPRESAEVPVVEMRELQSPIPISVRL